MPFEVRANNAVCFLFLVMAMACPQVRFEMGYYGLKPDIKVITPWREWDLMSRTKLIEYAEKNDIAVPTVSDIYRYRDRCRYRCRYRYTQAWQQLAGGVVAAGGSFVTVVVLACQPNVAAAPNAAAAAAGPRRPSATSPPTPWTPTCCTFRTRATRWRTPGTRPLRTCSPAPCRPSRWVARGVCVRAPCWRHSCVCARPVGGTAVCACLRAPCWQSRWGKGEVGGCGCVLWRAAPLLPPYATGSTPCPTLVISPHAFPSPPPPQAPNTPTIIDIEFAKGDPVAINGVKMSPATLLAELNRLGGSNGIGRLDLVESRFVGMKSRGGCSEGALHFVFLSRIY